MNESLDIAKALLANSKADLSRPATSYALIAIAEELQLLRELLKGIILQGPIKNKVCVEVRGTLETRPTEEL